MEKTEQQLQVTLPGRCCVPAPVSSPHLPWLRLIVQNGFNPEWQLGRHEEHQHLRPMRFVRAKKTATLIAQ